MEDLEARADGGEEIGDRQSDEAAASQNDVEYVVPTDLRLSESRREFPSNRIQRRAND